MPRNMLRYAIELFTAPKKQDQMPKKAEGRNSTVDRPSSRVL